MRTFEDASGDRWTASIRERPGPDYKGRYHFYMLPEGADDADGVSLLDIRWTSERTARRTLETMSEVELRRRLRQAVGRSERPATGGVPASGSGGE